MLNMLQRSEMNGILEYGDEPLGFIIAGCFLIR